MRELHLPMRVWDIPTRLFHWLLVILVFISWLSQRQSWIDLHMLCGYAILTLLIYRLVWGLIGSDTARFSHFLKSPFAALRHLSHLHKREPDTEVGHNAAGGWMVLVILGLLAVQVGTGLFANDDISAEGPLSWWVGKAGSDAMTQWHSLSFTVIKLWILSHVLALATYFVLKGHNLVRPMITGKKRLPGTMRAPRIVHPVLALIVLVLSAGAVTLFVRLVS